MAKTEDHTACQESLGGLGGLVAIGALVVELLGLGADWAQQRSQGATEATSIAMMDAHLAVQREIATFQASDVATGPTATAVAERVVQLVRTRDALESERRKVEATLAPVAPGVPEPTFASPPPIRMLSQVPDVAAELVDFSSFENTITVKVRFTNSSEEGKHLRPTAGTYVLGESSHNKYWAYEHSNSGMVEVPAGGSLSVWAKYGLPEGEKPQHLTVALPNGVLFEHLEIR